MTPSSRGAARYTFGEVHVDVLAHVARRGEDIVRLTPVEFDLLVTLLRRRGELVTKRELYQAAWIGRAAPATWRVLATHILNLRRKLEPDPRRPKHILTIWGIGYRLDE